MRTLLVVSLGLLAGCSVLETLGEPRRYPADTIWVDEFPLGLELTRAQLDSGRYRCLSGLLYCEAVVGRTFDCRCP